MFLVTGEGVIVVDAPPSIGVKINDATAEVTNEPVKYLVYSHAHKDHMGGAYVLPVGKETVAQRDTLGFLKWQTILIDSYQHKFLIMKPQYP